MAAALQREAGGARDVLLLTDEDSAASQAGKKARFGRMGSEGVLVTHEKFATSHTFDDPTSPTGRGARLLVSVQFRSLKAMIQVDGRARRRMAHAAYGRGERDVKRFVVVPIRQDGAEEPQQQRLCESVFHDAVESERAFYEGILTALFLASYGRDAFWERRPSWVEEREEEEEGGVASLLSRAAKRAAVHARAAATAAAEAWEA